MHPIVGEWKAFETSLPAHVTIIGEVTEDLLAKPVAMAWGPFAKAGKGCWDNRESLFGQFLHRLCHPREGHKDGVLYCQGTVQDRTRSTKTMREMSLICADVDSGFQIERAAERVLDLGIAAALCASHSHGAISSEISSASFAKWKGEDVSEPTVDEVQTYLREHPKYDEAVIESISAVCRVQEKKTDHIKLTHAPIDKYRIIAPLAMPVDLSAYETLEQANREWGYASVGFAIFLGIRVDPSCKDSSRGFYFPSKAAGTPSNQTILIAGRSVTFEELRDLGKQAAEAQQVGPTPSPPHATGSEPAPKTIPRERSEAIVPPINPALKKWAAIYGRRFKIATALSWFAPELMGSSARQGRGRHFRCCPLSERHSNPDEQDRAAFACDANETSTFQIRCMHAGCCDEDRLVFVQRLLDDGILPREALTDPQFLVGSESASDSNRSEAIGDGEGRGGFYRPIGARIASYLRRFGNDAHIDAFKDALRRAIESAPARNRHPLEIERYLSDRYLDNAIKSATLQIKETQHA